MGTQPEKLEATKKYNDAMEQFARYQAVRNIISDGEFGIQEAMEQICDLYTSKEDFTRNMNRVANNAWESWKKDNEEDSDDNDDDFSPLNRDDEDYDNAKQDGII
jgi:hypothetical protein